MCTQARMPSVLAPERERVVEVLRRVRIDRVGQQVAQVDPVRDLGLRVSVVRLERLPRAALDEQRLEHVLDAVGRAEPLLDLRPAAAGAHDGEVAGLEVADPLRLEHDRHAGREVRLADDAACRGGRPRRRRGTASLRRGGSGGSSGRSRSRRAPRPMPTGSARSSGKASACTSASPERCGRIAGSAIALPITRKSTARTEPASPQKSPSSMNGPRTNQFVAPTSFITSISRRREKIDSRIVFAISRIDAISRTAVASVKTASITCATCRIRCETCLPSRTLVDARRLASAASALVKSLSTFSALFGVTSSVSRERVRRSGS